MTLGVLWDYFGGIVGTALGEVWRRFEGKLTVVWVVPWGHSGDTLGVTLGLL